MNNAAKYVAYVGGLLISVVVFVILNVGNFGRPVSCDDCFVPYGLPFTFFIEGGFVTVGRVVWYDLLGDCLAVCVVGAAIGFLLNRVRFVLSVLFSFRSSPC